MDGGEHHHQSLWLDSLFRSSTARLPSEQAVSNDYFVPLPLLVIWVLCAVFYLLNDTIWSYSSSFASSSTAAGPSSRLLEKTSSSKFKVGPASPASASKKKFIAEARKEVTDMKEKMGFVRLPTTDPDPVAARRPLLGAGSPDAGTFGATSGDQSDSEYFRQHRAMHESHQDEQLGRIAQSVDNLREVSHRIGGEVEDQAIMIDDLNHETAVAQSRMDVTTQKVAKLLGLSTEKRQWAAIGGLTGFLIFIIILFFAI